MYIRTGGKAIKIKIDLIPSYISKEEKLAKPVLEYRGLCSGKTKKKAMVLNLIFGLIIVHMTGIGKANIDTESALVEFIV